MKVHFRSLCFYETSTLVPVYTNQNKSKEDFHLYKKKKKKWRQNSTQRLFCSKSLSRQHTAWAARGAAPSSIPPELHSASQYQTTIALNCVCEHLCFISVYTVHIHQQDVVCCSVALVSDSLWVREASLSFTISWSLLKLMSIELVIPSNHVILCWPLFLLTSIFSSIRVFSNESALCMRWPKYWSFSFSIMYPKAIVFSSYSILAYKSFHRNALLSDSVGNCFHSDQQGWRTSSLTGLFLFHLSFPHFASSTPASLLILRPMKPISTSRPLHGCSFYLEYSSLQLSQRFASSLPSDFCLSDTLSERTSLTHQLVLVALNIPLLFTFLWGT